MRDEYITDAQGRTVRAKHAAILRGDGPRQMVWADIRTATREHMEAAFQNRRQQIVGDCRHLKSDVDCFNENRCPANPIQLVLNFTNDVAEIEAIEHLRGAAASNAPQPPWRRFQIVPPPSA